MTQPNSHLSTDARATSRFAVIGAGISGLAAALHLLEKRPAADVHVFESKDRAGGVLQTRRRDGFLIETAADNFLRGPTAPWAEQFCQTQGLIDELIPTNTQHRGAHIVSGKRLIAVPEGFQLMAPSNMTAILRSPLLSLRGRLRLMCEPLIGEPKGTTRDESLTEFATRRLGREAFDRLVQPLVSGIYTADPDRLSVAAAVPQMLELVREHGSLYAGMRARQRKAKKRNNQANAKSPAERGARYSLFVAPREGMSYWVDRIVERVSGTAKIHFGAKLDSVRRSANRAWEIVHCDQRDDKSVESFDGVVIATPAHAAANLILHSESELGAELAAIRHASSAVVCLAFDRAQIQHPLDAFGCVVPANAGRSVIAISYSSNKFPDRAPQGKVLLRVFVGGALQGELLQQSDAELQRMVQADLAVLIGTQGEPDFCEVVRWPLAMPQYELGHLERVQRIESHVAKLPGLALAGNGYRGVGIPQCIRSGQAAADKLLAEHQ